MRRHELDPDWQGPLVDRLLRIHLVAMLVMLIPFWLLTESLLLRLVIEGITLVFLAVTIAELLSPRLGTRGRARFLLANALAVTVLGYLIVGFLAGPALLAAASLLLAQVLFGPRVLAQVIVFLLGSIALIGWATVTERLPWEPSMSDMTHQDPELWLRTIGVATVLVGLMGAFVAFLVNRMNDAMRDNRRLYRKARAAVRARDEFLAVASRELGTPMTALELSAAGITSGRIAPTSENIERTLALVGRNVERLERLIRQLLDVSRIAGGRLDLDLDVIDLSAVVEKVAARPGDRPADQARVSLDLEPAVLGRWDRQRLEQVVSDLLATSLRYADGAPVQITVRRRGSRAQLTVRDHGPGIPPRTLEDLFERFAHGDSRQVDGALGLGLYITRAIVRSLGGHIDVESTSSGATFTVELPLGGPHREPSSAQVRQHDA